METTAMQKRDVLDRTKTLKKKLELVMRLIDGIEKKAKRNEFTVGYLNDLYSFEEVCEKTMRSFKHDSDDGHVEMV